MLRERDVVANVNRMWRLGIVPIAGFSTRALDYDDSAFDSRRTNALDDPTFRSLPVNTRFRGMLRCERCGIVDSTHRSARKFVISLPFSEPSAHSLPTDLHARRV